MPGSTTHRLPARCCALTTASQWSERSGAVVTLDLDRQIKPSVLFLLSPPAAHNLHENSHSLNPHCHPRATGQRCLSGDSIRQMSDCTMISWIHTQPAAVKHVCAVSPSNRGNICWILMLLFSIKLVLTNRIIAEKHKAEKGKSLPLTAVFNCNAAISIVTVWLKI